MFYLQRDNYLVTMNRSVSQYGWEELLIDEVNFSRQPVIGGLYHFNTIGSVWFHWNGEICFYLPNSQPLDILVIDILQGLYRIGLKAPYVVYESFPPPQFNLIETLTSKTYKGICPLK